MKMAVIGAGYVGTVTGACMADLGHHVVCVDVDGPHIERLKNGVVDFYEEGLESLIKSNLNAGRLSFTSNLAEAVSDANMVFLCMGAKGPVSDKPDMRPLHKAIKDIAMSLKGPGYTLIVEKSALPIKTGDILQEILDAEQPEGCEHEYELAAVPQFMREGNAIYDFMHPDRVVIGSESQRAIDMLVNVYRPLHAPMFITDINSAELIKHATNAFLAMKISFINSLSCICEKTGADITKVAKGLGMDKRIAPDYLQAGIGYGGIFFTKDINSLLSIADELHVNLDLLKMVGDINRYQRISFIERISSVLGGPDGRLDGKTIGVWGLAFRPDTDDMRDSPSVTIIRGLEKRGATIKAFDPIAIEKTRSLLPHVTYCQDPYEAATGVDAIAVLTEWQDFTYIDFQKLKEVSDCRLMVDGRNLFTPKRMKQLGYTYISMGRKTEKAVPLGEETEEIAPVS